MVSESDTKQCANEDIGPMGVDGKISPRLRGEQNIRCKGLESYFKTLRGSPIEKARREQYAAWAITCELALKIPPTILKSLP